MATEMLPNGKFTFDDVFKIIGGMGTYQIVLFSCGLSVSFFSTENLAINFMAGDMEHWCKVTEIKDLPFSMQKDIAIPFSETGSEMTYSECEMFDLPYWNYTLDDFLTWNRSEMIDIDIPQIPCQDWTFDRSLFIETVSSQFQLVCGQKWKRDLLPSLHMAGVLIGALMAGFISDMIGRRTTALTFNILKIICSFMSALAPSFEVLIVARVLLGLTSTGLYLTFFVLGVEIVGPRHRVWTCCVYMVAFSLGFCTIAGMGYLVRDHIKLGLCLAGPNIILVLLFVLFPESPRWLILKGRYRQADEVIQKIAHINGHQLPENFRSQDIYVEKEDALKSSTMIDLFRKPTIRKRTLILYLHWFTDSLMYYALSLNTAALAGNIFLNTFISGAVEIPANIFCWLAMDWKYTGRRLTNSLSLILAGVFSFANIPLLIMGGYGTLINVFSQIGKAFSTMAFTGIYLYSSEIFPTEVRNAGVGTASMSARISGMMAFYVGGPLADVWAPLPSLIFGVLGLVSGGLTLLLPETLGQKLPETIEEAEHFKQGKTNPQTIAPMTEEGHYNMDGLNTHL